MVPTRVVLPTLVALVCLLSLLSLLSLAAAPRAHAQDPSFQTVPLGDRALGVGGAFTGFAADASAIWYNPGGMALLESTSVSTSLSFTLAHGYTIDDGYTSGTHRTSLNDEGSPNVPFFVGVVGKVGSHEDQAERRHALALTVIRPTRASRQFEVFLPPEVAGTPAYLRIREDDVEQLFGAGYAYRVTDDIAVGASVYLDLRSFLHEETETSAEASTMLPDGSFTATSLAARASAAELSAQSILFRLGALFRVSPELRLGLTFQPPNIPIAASGRIAEHTQTAAIGTSSATVYGDDQALDGSWPIPWELRMGAAWRPIDTLNLSLDGSLVGPLGSDADPVRPFGQAVPATTGARVPIPGRFVAQSFQTNVTANVAVGAETVIADVVPLSIGFFTNFAPVPTLSGASAAPRAAHLDAVGATLVVGYRSGGYNVAVGSAFVFGWGSVDSPDAAGGYMPTDARSHAVFLFVTGYASAAKRVAEAVNDNIIAPALGRQRSESESESESESDAESDAETETETETDSETDSDSDSQQPR